LPEAETPSYEPDEISWIMSSDVAPSFVLTWQPVSLANSFVSWA
jgi:hypothetical protein